MLSIRLRKFGAKKKPFYRVVLTDSRSPRDGRFLEILGFYNPLKEPMEIKLDLEKTDYWIKNGAKPSDTVKSLIKKAKTKV